MKWVVKAAVQQVLGSMPGQVADPIYHGFQQLVGTMHIDIHEQRLFIEEVAALLEDIRGKTLSGLRIVELGSGWFPVLPLLLVREFGALSVDTYDVNRHYSPARVAATAREIMKVSAHLKGDFVLEQTALTGRLPDSIRYHSRTSLQHVKEICGGPADLALSFDVLQYVAPATVREIHISSRQWLMQDAPWVHFVVTSDERAIRSTELDPIDFLRYSDKEWMGISGNRYAYQNRLSLPPYESL